WRKHKSVIFKYILLFESIILPICLISIDYTYENHDLLNIILLSCSIGWLGALLITGTFRRIICLLSGGVGCGLIFFLVFTALAIAVIVGMLCGLILGLLVWLTGALPHSQIVTVGYRTGTAASVLLGASTVWGVVWGILVCAASGPPRAGENY